MTTATDQRSTTHQGAATDRVQAAHDRLAPVFEQIAATAVSREAAGELDRDAVHALRDAGYTRLRVPEEYGGSGLSFEEASWFLVALGRADSNLAQALRAHWLHVEDVLSRPADDPATVAFRDRWLRRVGDGAIVGNALTERGNVRGQTATRLRTTERRDAEGHPVRTLTGEKFYSTGAAYADWILVSATDDDGAPVSAAVPSTAPGITIVDDWDGFGQQLTASGTTRFDVTPVPHADIAPPGEGPDSGGRVAFGQALAQYVHLATLLGIGQAVVHQGAGYVRSRSRGFSHGAAELPREDPQVLQVVGQASSTIFGARAAFAAILPELARQLQADAEGRILPESDVDRLYLSVYQAQQVIAPAVLAAATAIFEVGGASAASASRGLDRHWRNARVLASHNPLIYRARIIGDWEVNATPVERSYTVGTPGQQQ